MNKVSRAEQGGKQKAWESVDTELHQLRWQHARLRRRGCAKLLAGGMLYVAACLLVIAGIWVAYQIGEAISEQLAEAGINIYPSIIRDSWVAAVMTATGILWYFGSRLVFGAKRCFQKHARLALLEDTRTPVLYLRSFVHDETQSSEFGRKWKWHGSRFAPIKMQFNRVRSEELVVKELARCVGPVIAIGRPGEPLPELGAYRFYAAEDSWRDDILKRITESRLVVVRTGDTEGVLWELGEVLDRISLDRLVLYSTQQTISKPVIELVANKLGVQLKNCRFAAFDSSGTPFHFDTVKELLGFHALYTPKQGTARLVDVVEHTEFRVHLGMTLSFVIAATMISGMLVVIFDVKHPAWVFWFCFVLFVILYFLPSFLIERMRRKKVLPAE